MISSERLETKLLRASERETIRLMALSHKNKGIVVRIGLCKVVKAVVDSS
jgi:hypothetical protein